MSNGIVLKNISQKDTVILLDENKGKVSFFVKRNFCVGSLVYYLEDQKNNLRFQKIELVGLPIRILKEHLLFFHHVFEICYYFAPYCLPANDIYKLILRLYSDLQFFETTFNKKLFVGRLLYLLGVCPEDDFMYVNLFSKPIDIIMKQDVNLTYERKLSKLLLRCIQMHPSINNFKTVHFLNENGVP